MTGRIAGDLDRFGHPIGVAEPMIAVIAASHGLELVTGITANSQRLQQIGYPLVLRDWRMP